MITGHEGSKLETFLTVHDIGKLKAFYIKSPNDLTRLCSKSCILNYVHDP